MGVCEPKFLADPSHHIKVMVKPIFVLVATTKKLDEVKNVDALILKKYMSCYIMRNRMDNLEKFIKTAKAPVEQLFGNHAFRDPSWCWWSER